MDRSITRAHRPVAPLATASRDELVRRYRVAVSRLEGRGERPPLRPGRRGRPRG